MKAYSHIIIFICCICKYMSVDIMPELKRYILNFGYRIILPTIKFLPINFDSGCNYLNVNLDKDGYLVKYLNNF